MKNLLYKEFKLAISPVMLAYLACSALLLIPSWPFFCAFLYLLTGFLVMFFNARANRDIFFTACLPIRKRDIVYARVYTIVLFELMQVVVAIPFACLYPLISPQGNAAGMNPNFAFFGFLLILYAIFNAILFPWHYKTAYQVGMPMFTAIFVWMLIAGGVEVAVHVVPVLNSSLNAVGAGHLGSQLIVLGAGAVIFILFTWLAAQKAARNFDKVDV